MDNCPKCNSSWIGTQVQENDMCYGNYYKREICIDGSHLGVYNEIVAYLCPDCNTYAPVASTKWAMEIFNKFIRWKR